MKPKIELGKEYPTRGGGIGVVHFIDGDRLIGRVRYSHSGGWLATAWYSDGRTFTGTHSHSDLLFPRTVMVPVTVPEWAKAVRPKLVVPHFSDFIPDSNQGWIPIEDWIASLEGEDE